MKTFDELWEFISKRPDVIIVQDKIELNYVYDLMKGCDCKSYLEVGTAEGNSLYVLGHAIKDDGFISYIDLGENHTKSHRQESLGALADSGVMLNLSEYLGDSTDLETYKKILGNTYDCVLIDGGHDFATVLSDAILYAPLATKYVFFHDIQLPEVKAAVDWFVKRWDLGEYSEVINSDTFGYGIIKVK